MRNHDQKCPAHGFGPGQRMDICICLGVRMGREDEREKQRNWVLNRIGHDDCDKWDEDDDNECTCVNGMVRDLFDQYEKEQQ